MFLLKHINLWKFNSSVFVDLVEPAIKFVEALKSLFTGYTKDKIESENFKFIDYWWKSIRLLTLSLKNSLMQPLTQSKSLLPTLIIICWRWRNAIQSFCDPCFCKLCQDFEQVAKDMIYLKLLLWCSYTCSQRTMKHYPTMRQ